MGSILGCSSKSATGKAEGLERIPHFLPKAKRVIFLRMAGLPSQLELFDYKPDLMKLDGKDCPASFIEGAVS